MKDKTTVVELERYQADIILKALSELKNNVEETLDTTDISEIQLKIINAPEKKMSLLKRKDHDER